jgi:hypothetical protein
MGNRFVPIINSRSIAQRGRRPAKHADSMGTSPQRMTVRATREALQCNARPVARRFARFLRRLRSDFRQARLPLDLLRAAEQVVVVRHAAVFVDRDVAARGVPTRPRFVTNRRSDFGAATHLLALLAAVTTGSVAAEARGGAARSHPIGGRAREYPVGSATRAVGRARALQGRMRVFSFLIAAALVLFFAACSADAVSFSSETCNDQKCCGRSCCTKEAGWCQHPQCTDDASCGAAELYACVDGACEPHFRTCSSDVCCSPGTWCVSGIARDRVCAPLCDKSHACPGGYECNASGACQPGGDRAAALDAARAISVASSAAFRRARRRRIAPPERSALAARASST